MSEVSLNKFKQLVCENSPEMKEFERRLQTAYNQKMLEAQLAIKKTEKLRLEIEEKEIGSIENQRYYQEQARLIQEEETKKKQNMEVFSVLQQQIRAREREEKEELDIELRERLHLEAELQKEQSIEERRRTEKEIEKIKMRKEQLQMLATQRQNEEDARKREAEEEKSRHKEATRLANYDDSVVQKRLQRLEAFEKIKLQLLQQLQELDRLAQEREQIRSRLHCLEKEEKERIKTEEEEKANVRQRLMARRSYEDIDRAKQLEKHRLQQEDRIYAANVAKVLAGETEREKAVAKETRRVRTAVRIDNTVLTSYRRDRQAAELEAERLYAEKEIADRDYRDQIVRKERLRLLRSLDDELLSYLPPGTLTAEDLLCVNRMPQNNLN